MNSEDHTLREESLSSEWGFEGKLVRVRIDHVRLPNGRETRREIVAHPGAVAIAAITGEGEIWLVRQWRQAAGRVLLELPAGTLEPGEDPLRCAQRELAEEVGLEAASWEPLFATYLAPGYSEELLHTFLATDLTPVTAEKDWDEALEPVRMPIAEAADWVLTGRVRDAKTVCGILVAQHRWQSIHGRTS